MKKVGSESLVKEESLRSTWAQLSQVPTWKEDFSQRRESGPAVPVTTPLAHSTEMGVEDCSQENFLIPLAPLLTGNGQMRTLLFSYATVHLYVDIIVLIWLKGEDVLDVQTWFSFTLSDG